MGTRPLRIIMNGVTGRMVAIHDGRYSHAPLPDPKLGSRRVDVAHAYNAERFRPQYAGRDVPPEGRAGDMCVENMMDGHRLGRDRPPWIDEARAPFVCLARYSTCERLHARRVGHGDDLVVLNVRADLDGELRETVAVGLEVHSSEGRASETGRSRAAGGWRPRPAHLRR